MSDSGNVHDDEIIRAGYAERVHDAFRVFAENLSAGQSEPSCKERFLRAMQLARRARDLAFDALNGINMIEPISVEDPNARRKTPDPLSAEDQAMVDMALSKTTGVSNKPPQPIQYKPIQRR